MKKVYQICVWMAVIIMALGVVAAFGGGISNPGGGGGSGEPGPRGYPGSNGTFNTVAPMTNAFNMGGHSITNIGTNSIVFQDGTSISVTSNGIVAVSGQPVITTNTIGAHIPSVPVYQADGYTVRKDGVTFSLQPWITDNLVSLRYETWNHFQSQTRGLLDGPGYWFSDTNGVRPDLTTNVTFLGGYLFGSVGVTPTYTNLVAPSEADPAYVDTNSTKLTDGVIGGSSFQSGLWVGWLSGPPSIVFDFSMSQSLASFRFNFYDDSGSGILPPDGVEAYGSVDGETYDLLATGSNTVDWVAVTGDASWSGDIAISGDYRFVKLVYYTASQWVFLSEVEFSAVASDPPPYGSVTVTNSILPFVPAYCLASTLIDTGSSTLASSNVVFSVSRDDGTTWSDGAVSLAETWSVSNVLATSSIALTNQTSGSNVLFKITLTNACPAIVIKGMAAPCAAE